MPLKIKLKLKPPLIEKEMETGSSSFLNFEEVISFQRAWATADSQPLQYRMLRLWWPKVSKNPMPEKPMELLKLRIGYELQAKAYAKAQVIMPPHVLKNLDAARRFDVSKLAPNMRVMTEITMKLTNKQQEEGMKNKKGKETVKRQGVSQFYLEIFENQVKACLTDEQIVEVIKNKISVAPTLKNVASYRCMYNAGKLQGQKGVPSQKVKAMRLGNDKPKLKKPMSEETKAKLKTYTAAKKKSKLVIKKK